MPLRFCHPNTPHRKLNMPEWFVSGLMMERALDAVVRRAKNLDRKHDIPYLAGYSKDAKTIYIDRHMPASFRYDGRDINTDRYTERRTSLFTTAASRLLRVYVSQVETLRRLRHGGSQFVRVEHVHVNEGGQAVIGNVRSPTSSS